MGKRAIGGTTCPRCYQYTNILKGNILGQHRTDFYYPFSSRRELCVYSGGTLEDATAGITPLRRKTMDRQTQEKDTT
jgi:hypothetical protein